MAKKVKKVAKTAKGHKTPVLSSKDRDWLAELIAASLKAHDLVKKEPRSQKRRG